MNRKTIASAITCLLSLTLLAGCTSGASGTSGNSGTSGTSGTTASTQSAAPETGSTAASAESDASVNGASTRGNTLVVYFSATGNTKAVADRIAASLKADTFEILPEVPYSAADLDWTDDASRSCQEHAHPDARPALAGDMPDWSRYDTVFLGYPIWWGEAPNIVRTFLEANVLDGKTVIPFCTSSTSGLGSSAETLQALAPDAIWMDGVRFSGNASESDVESWLKDLSLPASAE